jgi:single-strand DNA-binding protein
MRDKNEVSLRGRLGKAPQYTAGSGTVQSRASFSLCTNYTYVTKDGTEKSVPEWHNVVVWGTAADNAAKYLIGGQQVEVNGRLRRREYEDNEGTTRRVTEVVANNIEYGAKPKAAAATPVAESRPVAVKRQQTTVRRKVSPQIVLDEDDAF